MVWKISRAHFGGFCASPGPGVAGNGFSAKNDSQFRGRGPDPCPGDPFRCHSSFLEPYLNQGFIELNSGGNFNSSKSVQVFVEMKLLLQLGQLLDGQKGASESESFVVYKLDHIIRAWACHAAWPREG